MASSYTGGAKLQDLLAEPLKMLYKAVKQYKGVHSKHPNIVVAFIAPKVLFPK